MGIKFLRRSLQMTPWWCFHHAMGSATTTGTACHLPDPPPSPTGALCIRLIRADGKVEVYRRPVRASELMRDHPMHLVCRSDAFTIGQRIPALAEGDQLQPGHAYFLLPLHLFQSVLSFVTLASSFAAAAAAAAASSSSNGSALALLQRPFDVQKTPSGKLQIRVCDDFIRRIQEAQDGVGGRPPSGRVCTTAALEKDYRQLVVGWRERQWKPTLETIRESERKKEKLEAVGDASGALGGIRRRGKKGHQHLVEPHRGREDQKQRRQLSQETKQHKKQQKKQEKQEKQKQKGVSNVTKHPNSPPCSSHKGKEGKKAVDGGLSSIKTHTHRERERESN